jgi:hypothetical protein
MNATSSNDPRLQEESEKNFYDLLEELNQEDKDIIDEEIATQKHNSISIWYSKYQTLRAKINLLIITAENSQDRGAMLIANELKKLL